MRYRLDKQLLCANTNIALSFPLSLSGIATANRGTLFSACTTRLDARTRTAVDSRTGSSTLTAFNTEGRQDIYHLSWILRAAIMESYGDMTGQHARVLRVCKRIFKRDG